MDWFSWLSRSNLEPSLTYEYGLAFARNELQKEDLTYFNHEFLQSMGISIAKHRLEILKLARKEAGLVSGSSNIRLSKLKNVINKTKKSIRKCISKLVFHDQESVFKALPQPCQYKENHQQRLQAAAIKPRRQAKSGPLDGRLMAENFLQNPNIMKLSGPLDGRVSEHLMVSDHSHGLKYSGPLDAKLHDRLVVAYRSPKFYGGSDGRLQQNFMVGGGGKSPKFAKPLDVSKERMMVDDYHDQSLWSGLFHDMKPT